MISTKRWLGIMVLLAIPVVNIIMLLIWAFSKNTQETLRNYARASLILMLIVLAIAIAIGIATNFQP